MARGQTIKIDFSQEVEGGGAGIRVPENDYHVKIAKVKPTRSSEKDTPGIEIAVVIADGKHKGKKIVDRLWITPKSLWRVRSLLEALGMTVPKSAVSLPYQKLVGKELGVTITDDDPYQGRIKSRISDFIDLDTLNEAAAEEDEDEDADDLEDEDTDTEEEDDASDLDEMDRAELKAHIKENELDVKVKKSMDDDAIREAIQEAEGEEDDDDESSDDDDDELDELDLDSI